MSRAAVNATLKMPVLGEQAFLAWLDQAAAGDRIAYHEGHLGLDRMRGYSALPEPVRDELSRVAGLALALADAGRLLLAQRRVAEDRVAYLAVMASKRKPKGGRR